MNTQIHRTSGNMMMEYGGGLMCQWESAMRLGVDMAEELKVDVAESTWQSRRGRVDVAELT